MKFMRAIIFTGGKQYNIGVGEKLKIELLDTEEKTTVFDKVLMAFNPETGDSKIGMPYLDGAKVEADIIEHGKSKKVIVGKYHAKTRYRRKIGHRQHYTEVKITSIT